jgi:hypothetical protein
MADQILVYKLKGDSIHIEPRWPAGEERQDHGLFYAERGNADLDCRLKFATTWETIRLFPHHSSFTGSEGECKTDEHFPDAINISYIYHGVRMIISEKSRQLLQPFIGSESVFLPVILEQSPEKYWALYVTKILDCLDVERSKFGRMLPKSIRQYHFLEEKLKDTYLFRLPGHYDFLDSNDFATQAFLNLVLDLGLNGFEFWECNKPCQDPIVS